MELEIPQQQAEIIKQLQIANPFEELTEIRRRTDFIAAQLMDSGMNSLVLGISGGIDSLTAGFLARAAVDICRRKNHQADFIAVRLPYGVQKDEEDALQCLNLIKSDKEFIIDIKDASDATLASLKANGIGFNSLETEDFVLGNIKARQRMIVQYAIANNARGLVIGTDHAAEAVMGFFTKYGDGGADITPLTGLLKRQVRAIAKAFGAPDRLIAKVPTADLESLSPLKPDETVYGISYEEIDDFLEGKQVSEHAYNIIVTHFSKTAHKRGLPAHP